MSLLSLSVAISVMTFEGTDCWLAGIGRLADSTGGRVRHRVTFTLFTVDDQATRELHLATRLTRAAGVQLRLTCSPAGPYICQIGK